MTEPDLPAEPPTPATPEPLPAELISADSGLTGDIIERGDYLRRNTRDTAAGGEARSLKVVPTRPCRVHDSSGRQSSPNRHTD
jgi:hypothetical protein